MTKLIINRGLPGSGKSTQTFRDVVADYENVIRVNRDDIRKMLHKSVWLGSETETNVIRMRDAMIRSGLKSGKTVISDDTNLDPRAVKQLAKIAEFFGADVEVRDFDVPLKTCMERNSLREDSERVPDDAFKRMLKFFKNGKFPDNPLGGNIEGVKFEKYIPDLSLPRAVIFDIDGTLADHEGIRSPYDYTKVSLDRPRHAVISAMHNYMLEGYAAIVLSGRDGSCRDDTLKWLETYTPFNSFYDECSKSELYMRPVGDRRQDRIIKGEIFDKHIRNRFNTEAVFDDRDSVVSLWRSELELDCFQVNYGDF